MYIYDENKVLDYYCTSLFSSVFLSFSFSAHTYPTAKITIVMKNFYIFYCFYILCFTV